MSRLELKDLVKVQALEAYTKCNAKKDVENRRQRLEIENSDNCYSSRRY